MTARNKINKLFSAVFYEKRLNKSHLKEKTEYSVTTVFNGVEELKKAGLLLEEKQTNSFGGKPSAFLSVNPSAKIGVFSKKDRDFVFTEITVSGKELKTEHFSAELAVEKEKDKNFCAFGILNFEEHTHPLSFFKLWERPLACCGNKWILKALTFRYFHCKRNGDILILIFRERKCFLLKEKVASVNVFPLWDQMLTFARNRSFLESDKGIDFIFSLVRLANEFVSPEFILLDLKKESFKKNNDRLWDKIIFGEDIAENHIALPLHMILYNRTEEKD